MQTTWNAILVETNTRLPIDTIKLIVKSNIEKKATYMYIQHKRQVTTHVNIWQTDYAC